MVYAITMLLLCTLPKVYVSSMSTPCIHYVAAMRLTYSLTSLSRLF